MEARPAVVFSVGLVDFGVQPSGRDLIVLLCDDEEGDDVQVVILGGPPPAHDAGGA